MSIHVVLFYPVHEHTVLMSYNFNRSLLFVTMAMSLARIVSRTIARPTLLNGSAATFASDSKEVSKEKAEIPYPTKEPKQIEEYFGFSTKPASSWGEYATMRLDDLLNLVQKNSIWFVLPLFGLASM
jgi:hypothetical protein